MSRLKVAIIGGGAAGFFGALQLIENEPDVEVVILEGGKQLLSKVRISGGGRCNVTHDCRDDSRLVEFYPRGNKELRQVFSRFSVDDMVAWLAKKGIALKTEPDGRMFPTSNLSQTIVNCFLDESGKSGVTIRREFYVDEVVKRDGRFILTSRNGEVEQADRVLFTIGGNASSGHYNVLRKLGIALLEPVPSLFTFNIHDPGIRQLMGISLPEVGISLPEFNLEERGPFLITHWGFSGPAVLKLSASAARLLNQASYHTTVRVEWMEERELIQKMDASPAIQIKNLPVGLPARLWIFLLERAGIDPGKRVADLSKADRKKLGEILGRDEYPMKGKTTFKEEFVTCGGVALKSVNMKTMESRVVPGLFFAGEVLDIDGYTGGFNFQAAWSTAHVAAMGIIASKTVNL